MIKKSSKMATFIYSEIKLGEFDLQLTREDFELELPSGNSVAIELALNKILPKDFNYWDIVNNNINKWTVAHICATLKTLPEDFNNWELSDVNGWTVAHQYINSCKVFPPNFKNYNLSDITGWSVAHEAAKYNCLPEWFQDWEYKNDFGLSVREVLEEFNSSKTMFINYIKGGYIM